MPSARPEIAIIGMGLMGRWHLASARSLGARVVGVVEPGIEDASELSHRAGAPVYRDLAALLAAARPRVVHVCSPMASHVAYARTLIDAGCHVICEKPLAESAGEVEILLAQARRTGRIVCPVHQFVFQSGVVRALSQLAGIGELRRIAFRFYSAGAAHQPLDRADRTLLDILPHPLSALARIGKPTDVASIRWHVHRVGPGEAGVSGLLGQALVSIDLSLGARPTEASATLTGTLGSIDIDFFHGYSVRRSGQVSRWHKATQPLMASTKRFAAASSNLALRLWRWQPAYPGLRELVAATYQAAAGIGPSPYEDDEILAVYVGREMLAPMIEVCP